MGEQISSNDKSILRDLAKKQLDYAHSEKNLSTIAEWYKHNAMQGERPMIHLEIGSFQQEVIPKRLKCEGETARRIEWTLYDGFLNHELFDDDRPVLDYFPIGWHVWQIPFDIAVKTDRALNSDGNNLGHQFIHHIRDLEEDFHLLKKSKINLNRKSTTDYFELIESLIGDILPPKMICNALYSVPTQDLVHIMGMETMFVSMYDYPELFHEMMTNYKNDVLEYYRFLEDELLLYPTIAAERLGQGTWCFNNELPSEMDLNGRKILTTDLWGFMDSQETVGISPEMFEEFIFPYYKAISEQFGMLSYGCCEPVSTFWKFISQLPNLRKISISPWCDEEYMGEALRGSNTIFHRKPSPNYLGVGATLDEDAFRSHIIKSLKAAKGCKMEITQRDVYTINNDESKAKRYIDIIREEIVNHW